MWKSPKKDLQWIIGLVAIYAVCVDVVFTGIIEDKVNRENDCDGEASELLTKIRDLMKGASFSSESIVAYIVPMTDAHNNEYVGERDKRVKFLTNFTGSTGMAVITKEKAILWVDSRYYLQAEEQVDQDCWTIMRSGQRGVPSTPDWINQQFSNSYIGVDLSALSSSVFDSFQGKFTKSGNQLVGVRENLVDAIWMNRPALPSGAIYPLSGNHTGHSAASKVGVIRDTVKSHDAGALVVSALDEIAWLLNVRGSDIEYNPVFYSYLVVTLDNIWLFVNDERITDSLRAHFEKEDVDVKIEPYEDVLKGIADVAKMSNYKIIVSVDSNRAIIDAIPAERLLLLPSVIGRIKAVKNKVEAVNIRKAHIQDGVALIRFLHWMEKAIDCGKVTELSAAAQLAEFRSEGDEFKGLSFETISAFGSHAAMAHYPPTEETDRVITRDEIYLVDSGGQYLGGTTDVTRTMHFGEPKSFERECFTRVLKGFIALVTSVFPENTSFAYFDYIARRPLWQVGLNYGHGTGHGVGAFLGVHEYPPLLSMNSGKDFGMKENMFTSNEPGFYKDGKFGIRLEDVIQVVKSNFTDAFSGKDALTFRSVTYAPIQIKMIDTNLLTKEEVQYINNYHDEVLDVIGPVLQSRDLKETYEWLVVQTQPIKNDENC